MRKRVHRLLIACLLVFPAFAGMAQTQDIPLELQGEMTQGSLIIGKTAAGNRVQFNQQSLELTDEGYFVFGFGRDAELTHELVITTPDEESLRQTLTIEPREYQIERVDGVPPATVNPDPEQVARARKEAEQVYLARQDMSQRTDFLKPVIEPAQGRISGVYGSQRILNGEPRNPHYGLDIAAPTGTPVIAPWSGRVVLAVPDMFYSGGTLIIDHGYGVTTTYIHLHSIWVNVGEQVQQGDDIAAIGATGRVTGPHLDWRLNWRNERLDPALLYLLHRD